MRITYDTLQRNKTFEERSLVFKHTAEVFAGMTLTRPDERNNYGAPRFIKVGWLGERIVMLVWTPRGEARRIISMRKANDPEITALTPHLGRF